jgi:hypothetical protein
LDNGFDDEKDPPLMYRDADQKNKRLPKTSEEEAPKLKTQINDSVCDVTQDLDESSDEEKVGLHIEAEEDEEQVVEEKE